MTTTNNKKNKRCFPFTHIIVTNPDERSAISAQGLLNNTLKRYIEKNYDMKKEIQIISTYDPFGARCGSFGGTLAALELIETTKNNNADSKDTYKYPNPTAWLINQLEDLYYRARIPKGSLLVTATDCLISLEQQNDVLDREFSKECTSETKETIDPFAVLGVCVPAPLNTAKNHGVYVMPEQCDDEENITYPIRIETPVGVLQKPSVDRLLANDTTEASFNILNRSGKQAWIDVGIVIFYPKAFQTIRKLSEGLLALCTRKGLEAAYHTSKSSISIETFAKKNALKIDLYTDILHNLPFAKKEKVSKGNTEENDDTSNRIIGMLNQDDRNAVLKRALSTMSLRVLVVRGGSFLHLGTTQELVEFITTTCSNDGNMLSTTTDKETTAIDTIMDEYVTQSLSTALKLDPRFKTFQAPLLEDTTTGMSTCRNVTLCSTFPADTKVKQLGSSTFVEYSDLESYESIVIGNHCMLSGWRNSIRGEHLHIPSVLSVQLLPLVSETKKDGMNSSDEQYVMMVLGTTDSIKTSIQNSKIYGVSFLDFINLTGVSFKDLGFQDILDEEDSIWTAKIHPVVRSSDDECPVSFSLSFGWIEKLRAGDSNIRTDDSLANWISADRVSLKDIHGISDAAKERERCQNIPCNVRWLLEIENHEESFAALCVLVDTLEDLAMEEIVHGNYDISGRALMLASASIADFSDAVVVDIQCGINSTEKASNPCMELIGKLKRSFSQLLTIEEKLLVMKEIFELRRSQMSDTTRDVMSCSSILELLALQCIEFVVTAGFRKHLDPIDPTKIIIKRKSTTIRDKLVLSIAPVRVDLAGGWSDTPPICYEYGGSASLVCLGMISEEQIMLSTDIQMLINQFCSSIDNVRMEIVTTSLLGMGTGMGTSSILGACIFQTIAVSVGIGKMDDEFLLHAVLMLEQLLSSGGGWQDQALGILPGVKTIRSTPRIPLEIQIEPIEVSNSNVSAFEDRLLFAYTGKTRLAKNILQQVLRRWSRRTREIVETVEKLVNRSSAVRDAFRNESWDKVGEHMYESYKLKCVMAGEHSGAEPEPVNLFISELMIRDRIKGAMLCGAGGGGFLLLLLSEGVRRDNINSTFEECIRPLSKDFENFSFHNCRIAQTGLTTSIMKDNAIDYKLSWQYSKRTEQD
ncbi:putative fucokinase [Fragilariopsis cylindrus CCMP1102]|uniref:Putative fucokinase n=1 Tax=Fragilariopsis cylindrus CCMP1102 TaxID=635003 RepID=A0A1E7FVD6_9STRA|nr:putative fucokinase [Fragilariopsis cylindrus CCMP1102]|eukprot:OEU22109.1 putative fucokinase [Fragilariopsis cylindrus CCMP1102]